MRARRQIAIGDAVRAARGSYDATQFSALLEVGYGMDFNGLAVRPLLTLTYANLDQDGLQETRAEGLNLQLRGSSYESFATSLGARVAKEIEQPNGWRLLPEGRLAWRHEHLDRNGLIDARFAGADGPVMNIRGTSASRDAAEVRLAMTAQHPSGRGGVYVAYDGLLGEAQGEHALSAGLHLAW